MDNMELLKNPKVTGLAGFVIGLFIGLVVLGWWLLPVQYTDAAPRHMETTFWQPDYVRIMVKAFELDWRNAAGDAASQQEAIRQAKLRWDDFGAKGPELLAKLEAEKDPQKTVDPIALADFRSLVATSKTPLPGVTPTPQQQSSGGFPWLPALLIMCLVTLVIAAALIYFVLIRGGKRPTGIMTPARQAQEAARQATLTDYAAQGEEPPMAQFIASYKLGDDLFDESFSIDSPSGEFLGECGVGISETIGVGDPKKVTAFEVWLFDKNDIQTVTKVIMSPHAFSDEGIRQRLAAKGEPVEAKPGQQVVLETATLQLVARVVEMTYGEGALPPQSFFDQGVLELAIWQK